MPSVQWVLVLENSHPPRYLRNYIHGSNYLTTSDAREAEPFRRAIDAKEMSRRVSWLTKIYWDVACVPCDEPLCALEGCTRFQAEDSTMCCHHRDMGFGEAVRELANRLTDDQITEAAAHAAVRDALDNAIAAFDPDGEDSDQDCHLYATRTAWGTVEVREEP